MMNMIKKESGFTLVELMVVILIIAILIVVAVPVFLATRTRAQDNVAKQAVTNAARASASYYAAESAIPDATLMEAEEDSYSYTDADAAPAWNTTPAIAVGATDNYLRITSQSGTVWKINVASGKVSGITSGD